MMRARCPACHTVFRVRAEHLRARQGRVRCGHCQAAFNALEHLLEDQAGSPEETHPAAAPPSKTSTTDEHFFILEERPQVSGEEKVAGEKTPTVASLADRLDFDIPDTLLPARRPAKETPPPPPSESQHIAGAEAPSITPAVIRPAGRHGGRSPVATPSSAPPDLQPPFASEMPGPAATPSEPLEPLEPLHEPPEPAAPMVPDRLDEPVETPHDERREPSLAVPVAAPEAGRGEEPPSAPDAEPAVPASEVPEVDTPTPWDNAAEAERLDATYGPTPGATGGRRWLWGIGTGILLGALAVQAAYLFRDEITREWPALRPAYLAACAELGCSMSLPRDAAYLGIETSDLESESTGGGRYVLNAVIRNRADFPQAWPHLELTLTDARDLPAARRVIAPEEWVPPERRDDGFPAGAAQPVRLPFDAPEVPAVGYRVYAFYP